MERLLILANDDQGEGILIDGDRHLVSQILVPNRFDFSHLTDITTVATPNDVYSTQMQLLANDKYWMWPIKGSVLTFPEAAKNHKAE